MVTAKNSALLKIAVLPTPTQCSTQNNNSAKVEKSGIIESRLNNLKLLQVPCCVTIELSTGNYRILSNKKLTSTY